MSDDDLVAIYGVAPKAVALLDQIQSAYAAGDYTEIMRLLVELTGSDDETDQVVALAQIGAVRAGYTTALQIEPFVAGYVSATADYAPIIQQLMGHQE